MMYRVILWTGWITTTPQTPVKTFFLNDHQTETRGIHEIARPKSTPMRLVLLHNPTIHIDLRLHHLPKLERLVWLADVV
jgi:hypothetical protein